MGNGEKLTISATWRRQERAMMKQKGNNPKIRKPKGIGVAIAIAKELKGNIVGIERANERIMKMRLETNIHGREITILNKYAPHMGYNTGEREDYWTQIGETLKSTNANDCIIWGTDNNGKLAQEKGKQGKQECRKMDNGKAHRTKKRN